MEAQDSPRLHRRPRDRLHGERARVRREDRFRPRRGVERPEDGPLRRQILERGLDDEVGVGIRQRLQRRCVAQPGEPAVDPRLGGIRIEIQSRCAALEPGLDPRTSALDGGRVHVVKKDPVAGLQCELGDAGAHRPGTDHADDLDRAGHGDRHDQTGLIASNGWRHSAQ